MAKATAEDVEAEFPEAVAFAKAMRAVFGDVKMTYARNAEGREIGRQPQIPLSTHTQN